MPPPYAPRPQFAPYAASQTDFDYARQAFNRPNPPSQRPFPAGEYPYPFNPNAYPQPPHSAFPRGKEAEARAVAVDPARKGRFDSLPASIAAPFEKPSFSRGSPI